MKNLRSRRMKNIRNFSTTVTIATVTKSYKNADISSQIFDGQDLVN